MVSPKHCLLGAVLLLACTGARTGSSGGVSSDGDSDAGADSDAGSGILGPRTIGTRVIDQNEIDFYTAFCEWSVRCQIRPNKHETLAECVNSVTTAATATFNSDVASLAEVRAGKASLDAAGWSSCLVNLSHQSCGVQNHQPILETSFCGDAIRGTVSSGGACIASQACQAGLQCFPGNSEGAECGGTCGARQYCVRNADCGGGVCGRGRCISAVPTGTTAGATCGTGIACADGLFCDTSESERGVCTTVPREGEPCVASLSVPCEGEGVVCVASLTTFGSQCQAIKPVGAECVDFYDCSGVGGDTFCDPDTMKCVAPPTSGPCLRGQCDRKVAYCDLNTAAGACRPYGKVGEACEGSTSCGFPYPNPLTNCGLNSAHEAVCVELLSDICTP